MSVDPKSNYYDAGGLETIEVIKKKMGPEAYKGFLLGNVLKYAMRLPYKGSPKRDAQKIAVYAQLLEKEYPDDD